jgi:pimeloyl-ACP methyl ester carboxylesterase
MDWLLAALATAVGASAAVYFLAPELAFRVATALARRSAGLRAGSITVDGHRIAYLDGGQGEPLLLLHGFGATRDHWVPVAPFLTAHFRVIAPDLPGFGDSSRDAAARYGQDEQIERIGAFARALGLTRFHLGGNSMGGYLAALFAVRQPEAVLSLWLLAPAGVQSAAASPVQDAIARGDNPLLVRDAAAFERLSALCFTHAPWLPAQFQRVLARRAIADAPFNARMFEHLVAEPIALESVLPACTLRALVVWGDGDRVLDPSGLEVLRGLMRNAECVLMRRMGHIPMVERPAETAAGFLRFHGRVPASG